MAEFFPARRCGDNIAQRRESPAAAGREPKVSETTESRGNSGGCSLAERARNLMRSLFLLSFQIP